MSPSSRIISTSPPVTLTLRRRLASASSVLLFETVHFSPFVVDGIAVQFSTATLPPEIETHFDVGGCAISFAVMPFDLLFCGGCSTGLIGPLMPPFIEAAIGPFGGALRGRWRSSLR